MSRIGQVPVQIPDGVSVEIAGRQVTAKGKHGELSARLMADVVLERVDDTIHVRPANDTSRARKMWGTARTVIGNLVTGVAEGFQRNLEIVGVGYRARLQGDELVLQLGYSHEIRYAVPAGIAIECPDQTHIRVTGPDKQRVGQTAAEIRAYRPPEPYKGKGIRYQGEYVLRKEGKKK